jgi:protein-L-isoaspartate(D-aspartate) O-methyltransferase
VGAKVVAPDAPCLTDPAAFGAGRDQEASSLVTGKLAIAIFGLLSVLLSLTVSAGLCQPRGDGKTETAPARLDWRPPRFAERSEERDEMVRSELRRYSPAIRSGAVLEAMRQVPRHLFVSPDLQQVAYTDRPLPIGYGQTISQPYIVALMTEALQLKAGARVLEIGTGSGYQAAVLSELTPRVFTMEIIRALGEEAGKRLRRLGYSTVQAKVGDGYFGWPEEAPFDGIIVTCAAGHIPPPLVEQLRPGGRMVIPLGGIHEVQRLMVVTKNNRGAVQTRELLPVLFVPMTGAVQKKP